MKKSFILVIALVLAIGLGIGATLAYLFTSTNAIENTFTYGDINIDLWEHKINADGVSLGSEIVKTNQDGFKMIPGNDIAKDPTVTVKGGSEACWLFVKVEKKGNFDNYMTCDIADQWIPLVDSNSDGVADNGVYYREIDAVTTDTNYPILANKTGYENGFVSVRSDVTKQMLSGMGDNRPSLTFTAYAVQKANVASASAAWEIIPNK